MPHYNYTNIREQWNTLPAARAYLGKDETGWVLCLDAPYVCVANVPLPGRVLMLDICPLLPTSDGAFPTLGTPIQRYFGGTVAISYTDAGLSPEAMVERYRDRDPADAAYAQLRARYRAFAQAVEAANCAMEGVVPGLATVNFPATCDLDAVLEAAAQAADLELTDVQIFDPDEDDENDDEQ